MAKPVKPYTYIIDFFAREGCPGGVINEMARYDGATVENVTLVSGEQRIGKPADSMMCKQAMFTSAKGYRPTMPRWTSFAVGAKLVE